MNDSLCKDGFGSSKVNLEKYLLQPKWTGSSQNGITIKQNFKNTIKTAVPELSKSQFIW